MSEREVPPRQAKLPESAHIYDIADHQYITAYRTDFKRVKQLTLIPTTAMAAANTTITGKVFEVVAYKTALFMLDIVVTSAPTDVLFSVEFSGDTINWYKYVIGPFGDLRYEDTAGTKADCLEVPILAPYMRAVAVATGTDASKIFTVTVRAVLNG